MELRFDSLLYTLAWVTKILMRAILNVHAGRRFPTFVSQHYVSSVENNLTTFETVKTPVKIRSKGCCRYLHCCKAYDCHVTSSSENFEILTSTVVSYQGNQFFDLKLNNFDFITYKF